MGLSANDGFEYGHQRSVGGVTTQEGTPLVIFGGGRWKVEGMEWGKSDDREKDEKISEAGNLMKVDS